MEANANPLYELVIESMMDEITKIAAHCGTGHAAPRKMKAAKPKSKTKKANMSIMPVPGPSRLSAAAKNRLMGGALGMALGLPLGGYMGYRREQKRLSPQEQAVVRQAMAQAYQQGNIAMYNRLKAMAQAKGKAQSK
jgi:uncharacterized protein HemX